MINLNALKYYYKAIEKEELQNNNINSFEDFKNYVIDLIINNLEYDFNLDFNDYVDINNFKKEVEQ